MFHCISQETDNSHISSHLQAPLQTDAYSEHSSHFYSDNGTTNF